MIVAAYDRVRKGKKVVEPDPSLSHAANFLLLLNGTKPSETAERALDIGARTYGSVKSILDNNLDRHTAQQRAADGVTILHPNIRGSRYYN